MAFTKVCKLDDLWEGEMESFEIDGHEILLVSPEGGEIRLRGVMGWAKQKAMTPLRLIALRVIMLGGGKFFPDLVRKMLQKVLITGKSDAPFRFERTLRLADEKLHVIDKIEADSWTNVSLAGIGCDQTSIYVVMSRTFQAAQLQPWLDLTPQVRALASGQPLKVIREL